MKAGPGHDTVPYFVIKMLIQSLPFHGAGTQALPSKLDLKAFNRGPRLPVHNLQLIPTQPGPITESDERFVTIVFMCIHNCIITSHIV